MSYLFVNENGAKIGIESERAVVEYSDGMKRTIPIETLESVIILGKSQMTTQATIEFIQRGIPVSYFSKGGKYFGCLQSTGHVNARRQRKQAKLGESNSAFAVELSKKFICGKIKNQQVLMKRYSVTKGIDVSEETKYLINCYEKVKRAKTINEIMGYEGTAAKYYFSALAKEIDKDFAFRGRNRRPPEDPFNSMISFGYSIIMNELCGVIQSHGLNPYFGFMHQDRENHPTLASDLIEEWRAVIVDSVVMSLINGHEIFLEHFEKDFDMPGCYLTKDGMKIFLNKLEKKLRTKIKYLSYVDYAVSFRGAIDLQVKQLVKAIEENDCELYKPVIIR